MLCNLKKKKTFFIRESFGSGTSVNKNHYSLCSPPIRFPPFFFSSLLRCNLAAVAPSNRTPSLYSATGTLAMAFWWPLLVLAAAYALCRLLLLLIPPTVPSIDVDASDGTAPFRRHFDFNKVFTYSTSIFGLQCWRTPRPIASSM
jgi:hypothetical protein